MNAINKLNKKLAGNLNVIAIMLIINTKNCIKTPLQMSLKKSLNEEVIRNIIKPVYITPIHKRGYKFDPGNYILVSLRSHEMKIFESVKSTQIQLLQHYGDVFEVK